MLDLNDPRDARAYVGELIAAGFPMLGENEDYRYIPDEVALVLAYRFFVEMPPHRYGAYIH